MSPEAFFFSTVAPAIFMGLLWVFAPRRPMGRKIIPLGIAAFFIFGEWQLAGPPQPQWPMVGTSILVYFSLAAAFLESTLQVGRKRWHGLLSLLIIAGLVYFLHARLVDSGLWSENVFLYDFITFLVVLILMMPGVAVARLHHTVAPRVSLIITGVALSIVALTSGSALMAQLTGILVGLQVAILVAHLVIHRHTNLPPAGILTFYFIMTLLILLIYFFVEVPRWPMAGVSLSLILGRWACGHRDASRAHGLLFSLMFNVPAILAAAWCVRESF